MTLCIKFDDVHGWMSVYVCMHVCEQVSISVCVCACMYVCVFIFVSFDLRLSSPCVDKSSCARKRHVPTNAEECTTVYTNGYY